LGLIKRKKFFYDTPVKEFFKKHKKVFPEDATLFFGKVIDENLQNTGDRYYEAITDAVRQIAAINRTKADEHLTHLRTNYKRRSNLMKLIDKL
jgi:hypothetical protein